MKVVIFCGGRGTRLQEATSGVIPKPMVLVGGKPLLWHIMMGYAHQGHKDFVLLLGHLGHVIKDFFLHLEAMSCDVTLRLGRPGEVIYHGGRRALDWTVTLVDTGQETGTGARLTRARNYLRDGRFMATYGDGVSDVDFSSLLAFHASHGRTVTMTGVRPTGRFGRIDIENGRIVAFREKELEQDRVNGGFLVFEPTIFDRVTNEPECMLEYDPLATLAHEGEVMMYPHDGFWRCVDTVRDLQALEEHWTTGNAPWRIWGKED